MKRTISIYYGAAFSSNQWPRGLGTARHKSHFTAELIFISKGIYRLLDMSSKYPDGSCFIQLVCLVTFISFAFISCCQISALVCIDKNVNVGKKCWQSVATGYRVIEPSNIGNLLFYISFFFQWMVFPEECRSLGLSTALVKDLLHSGPLTSPSQCPS